MEEPVPRHKLLGSLPISTYSPNRWKRLARRGKQPKLLFAVIVFAVVDFAVIDGKCHN